MYCQTISFTTSSRSSSTTIESTTATATATASTTTNGGIIKDDDETLYAGIFYYRSLQAPYECISYDELWKSSTNDNMKKKKDVYDVKWRLSKAFSSLSLIVGGILTILVILIPCGGRIGGRGGGRRYSFWKCSGWIFLVLLTTFQ